jgi:hypothetical protein
MPIYAADRCNPANGCSNFPPQECRDMDKQTLIPLADVATSIGVSVDKCRHWSESLGATVEKVNRVRHVSLATADRLAEMARLVAGGSSPAQAAAVINTPLAVREPAPTAAEPPAMAEMRQAILSTAREVSALREQIAQLTMRLDAPKPIPATLLEPPAPVRPWSPPTQRPRQVVGVRRWFAHLFAPETLRRRP